MKVEHCQTIEFRIYIAGPIEVAKQILRAECMREGLCVTIEPTLFIYTGGEEHGYVVGLRNYPRFPCGMATLGHRAQEITRALIDATHQHSAMVVGPENTTWYTRRKESQ